MKQSSDANVRREAEEPRLQVTDEGLSAGEWRSLGESNPCFSLERAAS